VKQNACLSTTTLCCILYAQERAPRTFPALPAL